MASTQEVMIVIEWNCLKRRERRTDASYHRHDINEEVWELARLAKNQPFLLLFSQFDTSCWLLGFPLYLLLYFTGFPGLNAFVETSNHFTTLSSAPKMYDAVQIAQHFVQSIIYYQAFLQNFSKFFGSRRKSGDHSENRAAPGENGWNSLDFT